MIRKISLIINLLDNLITNYGYKTLIRFHYKKSYNDKLDNLINCFLKNNSYSDILFSWSNTNQILMQYTLTTKIILHIRII